MPNVDSNHPIAYFCAEFGLEVNIPIYAGGLGILAGDTLKEAADQNLPMVGVGLLYRGQRMVQYITVDGLQQEADLDFDPVSAGLEHVYIDDMPLFVKVHLTEIDIWVRCWQKKIGPSVTLYLLDTDTDQNPESERAITHELYAGTEDQLLKQQLILGIGGVKLLHFLGIHPSIYHLNEGRPAFLHWQLVRSAMGGHGLSYQEAKKFARDKTVYTNHTLVGAGNPSASLEALRRYARYYADKMHISVDELLADGDEGPDHHFSTTRFALNVSSKASAVSKLHGHFSQQQWPNYSWVSITNGIHLPTWQDQYLNISDQSALWQRHVVNKHALADYLYHRTGFRINSNFLIITWSRRIVKYKQPQLLFSDLDRLAKIVRNAQQPVQLLIAGKAHQGDAWAKATLKTIIEAMQGPLSGHALFIPNYDLELASFLTKGSDVWLNTPEVGNEACGTSGMKSLVNGVLQLTVADGWTAELDINKVGWELPNTDTAQALYELLEQQVVPEFFLRSKDNQVSETWINKMKAAIAQADRWSTTRMMREYKKELYSLS